MVVSVGYVLRVSQLAKLHRGADRTRQEGVECSLCKLYEPLLILLCCKALLRQAGKAHGDCVGYVSIAAHAQALLQKRACCRWATSRSSTGYAAKRSCCTAISEQVAWAIPYAIHQQQHLQHHQHPPQPPSPARQAVSTLQAHLANHGV
jgi:hypothetical protein